MFNVNAYVLEWFKGFLLMAKDNFKFLQPILVEGDEMFNLRSRMLNYLSITIILYVLMLAVFQFSTKAIPPLVFYLDLLLIPVMVVSRFLYAKRRMLVASVLIVISGFTINTAIIF